MAQVVFCSLGTLKRFLRSINLSFAGPLRLQLARMFVLVLLVLLVIF